MNNLLRLSALALLSVVALSSAALRAADAANVIQIWPEGVPDLRPDATEEKLEGSSASNIHHPTLTVYRAPEGQANGTAMIVCPGGGYTHLSMQNEGSQVAAWLNSLGVTAFVLKYRLGEYGHPAPLRDVLRSVRLVRSRAGEFGVDAKRIGVWGASAGGHLAASSGTLFNAPEGKTGAELDSTSARPDFIVLLYPVITMKEPLAHAGSRKALLGATPTPEMIQHMSVELQVTKDTPPAFLVAAEDDRTVPVENSLMFYQALLKAKVPVEMHLFPKGGHGFGMKTNIGEASTWPKRCEEWMQANGWLTAAKP